jgi:hypothetical protein
MTSHSIRHHALPGGSRIANRDSEKTLFEAATPDQAAGRHAMSGPVGGISFIKRSPVIPCTLRRPIWLSDAIYLCTPL